ncbi:MAG TPA: hypothetical protein VNC59_07300 [Thermoanaerobaculia bacterium]|nr:hypothetical protein [Thermoanaerobaculia bacterium]
MRRAILSVAAVAAGVIAVLVLSRRTSESPPVSAVRDWSRIASGRLHLDMRTASPSAASEFFFERGIPFAVDPASLELPGYRLSGARVHAIAGRASALAVHRDARNKIVVCQRFEGRVEDLPRPDRTFARGPLESRLYRTRRGNAVFWQEGRVIRSLASDLPEKDLVALSHPRPSSAAP